MTLGKQNQTNDPFENSIEEIELQEYESICDVCKGTGMNPKYNYTNNCIEILCPKCQGEKKLDWVSVATGIAKKPSSSYSSSGGCSSCSPRTLNSLQSPEPFRLSKVGESIKSKINTTYYKGSKWIFQKIPHKRIK